MYVNHGRKWWIKWEQTSQVVQLKNKELHRIVCKAMYNYLINRLFSFKCQTALGNKSVVNGNSNSVRNVIHTSTSSKLPRKMGPAKSMTACSSFKTLSSQVTCVMYTTMYVFQMLKEQTFLISCSIFLASWGSWPLTTYSIWITRLFKVS